MNILLFLRRVVISKVRRKNYHFTHILFLFLFFTIHLVKKYEIIYIYIYTHIQVIIYEFTIV